MQGALDATDRHATTELKSYLGTRGGVAAARRGVTDVLVVTSAVGVLNGVHGNTANLGPLVTLDAVLVVGATSLEERLVEAATAGNEADHGARLVGDGLLHSRGEADLGPAGVLVVGDDDAVGARATGEDATVSRAVLDVAHDGTLRDLVEGKDVANGDLGLGAAVHELAGVHTLAGEEDGLVGAVLVAGAEAHLSEGST